MSDTAGNRREVRDHNDEIEDEVDETINRNHLEIFNSDNEEETVNDQKKKKNRNDNDKEKKRNRRSFLDEEVEEENENDEDEEYDDDDDDEEVQDEDEEEEEEEDDMESENEEDDGEKSRKLKKSSLKKRHSKRNRVKDTSRRSKRVRNPYIEEEAAVDEEEEEEEEFEGLDEYETLGDDFIDEKEAEEARAQYTKLLGMTRPKLSALEEESFDVEAEARRLKERYGRSESAAFRAISETGMMPKTFLAPKVTDPKLWMIKVKPGKEKEVVFRLLRKFWDRQNTETPLMIKSAIYRDNLKGFIYIEAYKQTDIIAAIQKTSFIFAGSKMTLVPISEMTSILKLPKKEFNLKPGAWVRVKRGKYATDLAQIIDLSDITETARIKLVPRLDIYLTTKSIPDMLGKPTTSDQVKPKPHGMTKAFTLANRPPAKLFNPKEISEYTKNISKSRNYWVYNNEYFKDGYLEKEIKWVGLETEHINPSLDEIAKFSGIMDGQDVKLEDLPGIELESQQKFYKGDIVEVIAGDLIKKMGAIDLIDDEKAIIKSMEDDGTLASYSVPLRQLRKYFKTGDLVKVSQGKYEGETGLIVSVMDNIVTIFSDISKKEFQVFSRDIREAGSDMSSDSVHVSSKLSLYFQYQIDDLVHIGANHIGVILKVDKEMAKVLDQNGQVRDLSLSTIHSATTSQKKLLGSKRNAMSLDAYSQPIRIGNKVQVLHGEMTKRSGVITHIHRQFIFIRFPNLVENNGLAVIRNSNVALLGANGEVLGGAPHGGSLTGSALSDRGRPQSMASRGGMGRSRRDPILNKTVAICGGLYKGYMGVVKEADESTVEVELHSNCKVVSVDRTKVQLTSENQHDYRNGISNVGPSMTPHIEGSFTPYFGMEGGRTPGFSLDSKTPMWTGGGDRTPAAQGWGTSHYAGTPAYHQGSRTPGLSSQQQTTGGTSWTTPHHISGYNTGGHIGLESTSMGWKTPGQGSTTVSLPWESSQGGQPTDFQSYNRGNKTPRIGEFSTSENEKRSTEPSVTAGWGIDASDYGEPADNDSYEHSTYPPRGWRTPSTQTSSKSDWSNMANQESASYANMYPSYPASVATSGWSDSIDSSNTGWSTGSYKTPSYPSDSYKSPAPPSTGYVAPPPSNISGSKSPMYRPNPSDVIQGLRPNVEIVVDNVERDSRLSYLKGLKGVVVESAADANQHIKIRLLDTPGGAGESSSKIVSIPANFVSLAQPTRKDKVLVIHGPYNGTKGIMIGIDGSEVIVKPENAPSEFIMLHIYHVAKLAS